MKSFEGMWANIRSQLRVGIEIRGWSRDKGHTSLRFKVVDVSPGSITVSSSTISHPRLIGKSDFARVHEAWSDYRAGKMSRAEMASISQNTSYIFGILQWISAE